MNQQVSQFELRQSAQAAQVSSWGNTLTGLTNVYDPSTGTQFQMFSGPKSNYYVNGNGDKVNSNVNPGNGFHQVFDVAPIPASPTFLTSAVEKVMGPTKNPSTVLMIAVIRSQHRQSA